MAPISRVWEAYAIIKKGVGKSQSEIRCLFYKKQFTATAWRATGHILSSRGKGVGRCTGKPPAELIESLQSDSAKKEEKRIEDESVSKLKVAAEKSKQTQSKLKFTATTGKELATAAVGRFFFSEGIAFRKVNSPEFLEMLEAVSKVPNFKPPDRCTLSTTILDKQYTATKEHMKQSLEGQTDHVTLTSDGWKATNKDPLINFLILTGSHRLVQFHL